MRRVREEVDRPRLDELKRDARKGGGRGAAETDCVGHKRGRVAGDEEEAAERRATAQRLDHVGVEAGAGRIDDGDQRVELRRSEPLEHLPRRLLRLGADELGVGDAVAGGVGGRIGNRLRVALDAHHSLDPARWCPCLISAHLGSSRPISGNLAGPMAPVPQQTSSITESGPRLHCARSSVSRLSAPSVLTWKNASGEMRKERPSSVSSMYSRPSTVSTPSASAGSPACLYSPGGAPRRTASERRTGGSSGATNASRSRASSDATCSSGKPAAWTATQRSSSGGPSACAKDWRASIARQKPSCETLSYGGSGDSARTACALRAAASISAETVGTPSARPTTCLRSRTVPRVKPTATLPSSSRPIVNSHLFR
mmetsp:Transcript_21160/g.63097  ORF Transcript_21160/g.63097 Transcript_21160/m.63097 type:complete len:371 (-) Transcript_21160:280-1392(-)